MDIKFKTEYCALNKHKPLDIDHKYVNVYVKLTSECNALCGFCVYRNEKECFKLSEFQRSIDEILSEGISIHKVSFTGGEPTLKHVRLALCTSYIRRHSPNTFIVVNTNGLGLDGIPDEVDSIALSRHHYNDKHNYFIFGSSLIPSTMMIGMSKHKDKIHLSCNLIKGYIDSKEEIYEYLEFAARLGIYDVGFVGLMDVNKYAKEHFVDIQKLKIDSDRLVKNKVWHYKKICKCNNYLYMPKTGNKLVKFYARHRCDSEADIGSNIIFDGVNLRHNFGGQIINFNEVTK